MAIVQISQIQQRSGNLVDLPQLNEAEFGFATDTKQLFIGKTTPVENIEVLTSYSNISFSQLVGANGNLDISSPVVGQVLAYDGNNWINAGAASGGKINLGTVSNVSIEGGTIGYVLQTDGTGNLSWTPKGTLYTNIIGLTNNTTGNIITMTVANTTPYVNSQPVTITGAAISNSGANSNINGHTFYIKLDGNFPTNGNVTLYTDTGLTVTANGVGLNGNYTSKTGIATAIVNSGSGGSASANGLAGSVQYNDGYGGFVGGSQLVFGSTGSGYLLTVTGNANVTNSVNTTSVYATTLSGNLITAAQPNITSVGTLSSLAVTGNITSGNASLGNAVTANFFIGSGNNLSNIQGANVSGSVAYATTANSVAAANISGQVANALVAGTVYTNAQPNITSVGTLSSLTVTGNISGANLIGNHYGNGSTLSSLTGANVTGAVAYATTANSVAGANVSGAVAYATTANSVAGANVSGAVAYATTANSVAGANVSGAVAYATVANSIAGANV